MSKRGRVDPGALRRDRRLLQELRRPRRLRERFYDFLLPWGPILVSAFEVMRIAIAPIRGTTAWLDGVLVGLAAGVAGAVTWWFLTIRGGGTTRTLAALFAVVLCLLFLTNSGGRGQSPPDVNSGFLAGAVTYEAVALANMTFLRMPWGRIRGRLTRFRSGRAG